MGDRKRKKRLILPFLFKITFLYLGASVAFVFLEVTPKGIAYSLVYKGCDKEIDFIYHHKKLADKVYLRLMDYFDKSSKTPFFDTGFVDKQLDELFQHSYKSFNLNFNYKKQYKYKELNDTKATWQMLDNIVISSNDGCSYAFIPDDTNLSSYKIKVKGRDNSVEITANEIKREYFLKFPNLKE